MKRISRMISKIINKYLILVLITIFAFCLRAYRVNTNPPALSWDEVSIGYNAYSVLKTGYDEHHQFLPFDTFVAYGDYKPSFAIYATIPFVAIFGLNELSVRLPSVLFGTFTVVLTYFLVTEMFRKDRYASRFGFVVATLLAISPWHIMLSRAGFEANIAVCWIVLGVYLCLRSLRYPKLLYVTWLPFIVPVYTFNSARFVSPLIALGLFIYIFENIKKNIRVFLVGVIFGLLFLAPIIPHLISPQARLRFNEVNIFSDISIVKTANERIARDGNTLTAKIIYNRRLSYFRAFLSHYFDNLQPNFLFIKGDGNPKFSDQNTGELYLIEAPLLILGIILLYLKYRSIAYLLTFWLLVSIIPAATARETPHALRIENSLPTWQIFVGFTVMNLTAINFNRILKKLLIFAIICIYIFEFSYFIHTYFTHYPQEFSGEWQYGYREALQKSDSIYQKYQHIVISDSIGRPYMYTLFYEKYDPRKFWISNTSGFDAAGFYDVKAFAKYEFIRGKPLTYNPGTLYILDPINVPENAHIIDAVHLLNGNPVLVIFDIL
jgi:4-amino-4-deoxy-L-arabinose transferase-like glycosyltransferase